MCQSGQYLQPEELERLEMNKDVEVTWERMSTSRYNGVDPKVLCCNEPYMVNSYKTIVSGSS